MVARRYCGLADLTPPFRLGNSGAALFMFSENKRENLCVSVKENEIRKNMFDWIGVGWGCNEFFVFFLFFVCLFPSFTAWIACSPSVISCIGRGADNSTHNNCGVCVCACVCVFVCVCVCVCLCVCLCVSGKQQQTLISHVVCCEVRLCVSQKQSD